MASGRSPVVAVETLLNGFAQAHARFDARRLQRESDPAFFALFEALSWAVALDERLAAEWSPASSQLDWSWRADLGGRGRVISGIRYARNSIHHQWADALVLDDSGFSFPMQFPLTFFDWRWRSDIPSPRVKDGELDYRELLAGEPARYSLVALGELFPHALAELSRRRRGQSRA